MTTRKSKSRRSLSDDDLNAIAAEVETADYDIQELQTRRRGRPAMGLGPAPGRRGRKVAVVPWRVSSASVRTGWAMDSSGSS